jgi:hypothetical protein
MAWTVLSVGKIPFYYTEYFVLRIISYFTECFVLPILQSTLFIKLGHRENCHKRSFNTIKGNNRDAMRCAVKIKNEK